MTRGGEMRFEMEDVTPRRGGGHWWTAFLWWTRGITVDLRAAGELHAVLEVLKHL